MQNLTGKTAFITGGAHGIGLATGRAFVAAGMRVALADIDTAALDDAVATLRADGGEAIGVRLDVTDRAGWERTADATEAAFGNIHVLVNNAGIVAFGWTVEDLPYEIWDRQIAINLTGTFNGTRCVLPRIRRHGEGGHVVNTSSMSGLAARTFHPGYVASKHAVVGLSDALRLELEGSGIGVSVLCPGPVTTALLTTSQHVREDTGVPDAPAMPTNVTMEGGMDAARLGELVVAAIQDGEFYVISHPELRDRAFDRFRELDDAFTRAAERG